MTSTLLPPLSPYQQKIQEELAKFTITSGSHTEKEYREGLACILEAFRLVLGLPIGEVVSGEDLAPPCMSTFIADLLMDVNDEEDSTAGMTNVHLALLEVAPLMLHTAPTTTDIIDGVIVTFKHDDHPDYERAEEIRQELHYEWNRVSRKKGLDRPFFFTKKRRIFRKNAVLRYLLELANVARFKNGVVTWGKDYPGDC